MRQLNIRVPQGQGLRVAEIASRAGGIDIFATDARDADRAFDVVSVNLGNAHIAHFVDELEQVPDVHITFQPRGVIALRPPAGQAEGQVIDVEPRSPLEVFLSGLQSIGSWKAFLGYAAAAGVVVWIALYTETVYLLTAAMLIAPFAGPAMNAALGTARGDSYLFKRSLLRYSAALAVAILVAFLLSLLMQQRIATNLMVQRSLIASVAVLLPLVAGAAGALNLCQSERSSLVSGAATGMLIAASLAPPAGLVGMGAAIGEWDMVKSAAFLLLLQIAGINAAGAIVFRLYGVRPEGSRFERGQAKHSIAVWLASLAALAALLTWQFSSPPELLRSTTAQRAVQQAREVIESAGEMQVIEIDGRFTRGDIPGQNTLLVTGYVQSRAADRERLEAALNKRIKARLESRYNAQPLIDVKLLAP